MIAGPPSHEGRDVVVEPGDHIEFHRVDPELFPDLTVPGAWPRWSSGDGRPGSIAGGDPARPTELAARRFANLLMPRCIGAFGGVRSARSVSVGLRGPAGDPWGVQPMGEGSVFTGKE